MVADREYRLSMSSWVWPFRPQVFIQLVSANPWKSSRVLGLVRPGFPWRVPTTVCWVRNRSTIGTPPSAEQPTRRSGVGLGTVVAHVSRRHPDFHHPTVLIGFPLEVDGGSPADAGSEAGSACLAIDRRCPLTPLGGVHNFFGLSLAPVRSHPSSHGQAKIPSAESAVTSRIKRRRRPDRGNPPPRGVGTDADTVTGRVGRGRGCFHHGCALLVPVAV